MYYTFLSRISYRGGGGGGGGGKGEKFHRKPKVSPPQRKSGIMLAINNYNIAITAKKIKGQFSPLITAKISSKPF